MTLYEYVWPVSYHNPHIKCILYLNKDIIYCGNVGEIPMKYGEYLFDHVNLNKVYKTLRIFIKDINKEVINENYIYERQLFNSSYGRI